MTWGFVTCGPNEALVVSGKCVILFIEIVLFLRFFIDFSTCPHGGSSQFVYTLSLLTPQVCVARRAHRVIRILTIKQYLITDQDKNWFAYQLSHSS